MPRLCTGVRIDVYTRTHGIRAAGRRHSRRGGGHHRHEVQRGFSRLWPSLVTVAGYIVAFALLAQTLKTVQIGTAYAIWAGAGTAVIAAIGMLFLGEGLTLAKVGGIVLVIGGVVLLNLGGAH